MSFGKQWTDADIAVLRKMRAAGASPARVSIVLKKSQASVKVKARELMIPFDKPNDLKRQRKEKERAARLIAGLSPEQK